MKKFQGKDYLLDSPLAEKLYEEVASKMPIFDFHCHLSPKEIAEDHRYRSITECWLGGDHYKWRLMRAMGVEERLITGDGSDYEKFHAFAKIMPYLIGNPVYEWCHLELKTYFGIDKILSEKTAAEIYEEANKKLETLTARKMLELVGVETVYTTDDPADDLHYHKAIKADESFKVHVYPCVRPDRLMHVERNDFSSYIDTLSKVSGIRIDSIDDLIDAYAVRLDYFIENGCSATDHGIDVMPAFERISKEKAEETLQKALKNQKIEKDEEENFQAYLFLEFGKLYHEKNLVMQFHIGPLRNASTRIYEKLGPDTGFDSADDRDLAKPLYNILNALDKEDELPKSIIYSINEKDYTTLATLIPCYQGGMRGKVQFGAAWWFNDNYEGIKNQMSFLASRGVLANFVGMLTDSRSFMSYPRHDYFRRELCSVIADYVNAGRYPYDEEMLKTIVSDICYNNAKNFFTR